MVPYYGYARADRKSQGRESIAAKLTANIITEAGASRVLAMDLHSGQCVGYFDIPVGSRPLLMHALVLKSDNLMPETSCMFEDLLDYCAAGGPCVWRLGDPRLPGIQAHCDW